MQKRILQIQFLDSDAVGALVPAFSVKPQKVVFLYDRRIVSDAEKSNVKRALQKRLEHVEVYFEQANMHSMEAIEMKLQQVIEEHGLEEIQIDLTGGTEIMTACGLLACEERGFIATYADFFREKIYDVIRRVDLCELQHLTLEDYLLAIGGKLIGNSRENPEPKDAAQVYPMAEYAFSHKKQLEDFTNYMRSHFAAEGVWEFGMGIKNQDSNCMKMLNKFLQHGFCRRLGADRYEFTGLFEKQCMNISGTLLEGYIYLKAKECYDDVILGACIDWHGRDERDMTESEIDVVIMEKSYPIFISCKNFRVEYEDVLEVHSLVKRLAGNYGRAYMATIRNISDMQKGDRKLYEQMRKVQVGLIEARDFKNMDTQEVFERGRLS